MSKRAIVPGSFDPITAGHCEIIRRAATIFDHVTVAVLVNSEKVGTFAPEERLEAVLTAIDELKKEGVMNVDAKIFHGLTVDAARESGADFIVKGIRNASDFDYEFRMALANKKLAPDIETVSLITSHDFTFVSSSTVKEVVSLGGDVRGLVPDIVREALLRKFSSER